VISSPKRHLSLLRKKTDHEVGELSLDMRNRNEESYVRCLIATISSNLAIISLPRGQTFLDTSIVMFVSSPFIVT
jgi:hypothetical protein